MPKTAVIGYGSTLRKDDGAGIFVVREIKKLNLENVECFEGYTAIDLLELFNEFEDFIIIDTGNINKKPGEFVKVNYKDLDLADDTSLSHNTNFKNIIALAKNLNYKIPNITFYIIQPKEMDIGEGLSENVKKGVDKIVEELKCNN